jgi:endonuclease/exonuclease/phosphatase family metal-dependent hydrolase
MSPMRLISINTWKAEGDYPRRIEAMAEALAAIKADVIALQEDFCTHDGSTHTARTLGKFLRMHLTRAPARAKKRLFNLEQIQSTSGLAILSQEPVLVQHILALPEDSRDGERIAQLVKIHGSQGDWWLANVHLTHLTDRPDLRHSQLASILSQANKLSANEPLVLCGDFNAEPASPELREFLQPAGPMVDAFAGSSKQTLLEASGSPQNLDHIFMQIKDSSRGLEVRKAWLALDQPGQNGVIPSDHCAVCADLF